MDDADALRAEHVEQWFIHRGLPHLIDDYTASDDIFTRAAPFLALVLFFELFTTFGDDFEGWGQLFAFLAGVAVIVGRFAAVNLIRGRRPLQLPDDIGPVELGLFVFAPAVLPVLFDQDPTVGVISLIVGNLVVLALVYVVASYALIAMTFWAVRQLRHQLGRLSDLVVKSLPLLLLFATFLFVNAEIWQVAHDFSGTFFALSCGLLVFIGAAFVLFSLRNVADEVAGFSNWESVCSLTSDTPVASIAPAELEGVPADAELSNAARRNLRLVLAVSLGTQIFLVAVVIGVFFVLFGLLAIREETIVQWVSADVLASSDVIGRLEVFGGEIVLTRQLLYVAGFIAAFSGLQFTVSVLTDQAYRKEFADELLGEVREALAVRAVYVKKLLS